MPSTEFNYLPKITIWIAARNEAEGIIECLRSINNLDYPKSKLQVLVGNDMSTDNTEKVVLDFIGNKPCFQLININKTINGQKGKANVLANLYEHSTGEYFLITDADVIVNKDWANGMLKKFLENDKIGHQVGVTSIRTHTIFDIFQSIDWLWALSLLKMAAFFKIPLTGLGNNSAVSRKAYESAGGYAKIPFSITEDFALFHEVVKKDFDFDNAIRRNVFAKTTAMGNLREFLHQRKRWMVGAMQCPWWVVTFLYLQALFPFILVAIGIIFSVKIALLILVLKICFQILLILPTIIVLKEYHLIPFLLPYEVYAWAWGFTMVVFYFLPIDIDWKGRIYNS